MCKKILKTMTILIVVMITLVNFNNTNTYAITAGGSSETAYNTEGKCECKDLSTSTMLVTNFLNRLKKYSDSEVKIKFNYKGNRAWEQDMKPGTWVNDSIDDVNIAIFCGHGFAANRYPGFSHNALHYYTLNSYTQFHKKETEDGANLTTTEAKWGKKGTSTRWVITFTCNFLNTIDPSYNSMMQGINIMMGFSSRMYINPRCGTALGSDMGLGCNIIDAFLNDNAKNQLSDEDTYAKVIYAEKARNDTIYNYAYPNKPDPIGGTTKYYSITRKIPAN